MRKVVLRMGVCLLGISLLAGCTRITGQSDSGVTTEELLQEIQAKYQEDNNYEYGDPILNLPRGQALEFALGFDFDAVGVNDISEVVNVFKDVDLTIDFLAFPKYDKEAKTITLLPPTSPDARIMTTTLNTEQAAVYPHDQYYLHGKDVYEDWGNVGRFYLVRYRNLETGRKLTKPVVTLVTIKGELDAPNVQFLPTDNGLASFRWNKVEGAESYIVFRASCDENNNIDDSLSVIGMTADTSWKTEPPLYGTNATENGDFVNYMYSQDDWAGKMFSVPDGLKEGEVLESNENYCFGVIAINQLGTSMVSNLFMRKDLASDIPYARASYTEKENGYSDRTRDIGLAPSHAWITMCSGYTVRKKLLYKAEQACMVLRRMINVDSKTGEYVSGEDVPVLEIPYTIEGTPFEGVVSVEGYQEENLEPDMQMLLKRQESLQQQGGKKMVTAVVSEEEILDETIKGEEKIPVLSGETITGNSALSEYLATCLLAHTKLIDISDFPVKGDFAAIQDALLEAYYQNPLILGISQYRMNQDGTVLLVSYENSADHAKTKQEEIRKKVTEITAQIIKPDMSELEKEFAINQYLCDTIEYDMSALENAQTYNFAKTDEEFIDSFSAYGALIDGKSVCAGYAAAFKLLCEDSGLECIVTTGMLDGQLPHAWNKVKIEDAWQVVDTTNNDNEEMFNVLLNLPQEVSGHTLVEDKNYILDAFVDDYVAEEQEKEYYRVKGKYFPTAEIAQQLVQELEERGKSTLRTDYELTDGSFQQIADQVYAELPDETQLSGYFWMGVIYLEIVG